MQEAAQAWNRAERIPQRTATKLMAVTRRIVRGANVSPCPTQRAAEEGVIEADLRESSIVIKDDRAKGKMWVGDALATYAYRVLDLLADVGTACGASAMVRTSRTRLPGGPCRPTYGMPPCAANSARRCTA